MKTVKRVGLSILIFMIVIPFVYSAGKQETAKTATVELKLAHVGSPTSPQQSAGKIFAEK